MRCFWFPLLVSGLLLGLVSCGGRVPREAPQPERPKPDVEVPDLAPEFPNAGFVEWQLWRDWPGTSLRAELNSPRWQEPPTRHLPLRTLESARDVLDHFAVRITGLLRPPETGEYRFMLESAGEVLFRVNGEELLFSSGGAVASAAIPLAKNQPVSFELLHKGGQGPDHLRLGWERPDGELEMPIGGHALASKTAWEDIRAANVRQVLITRRLRTYDADRHMARHPHNPRPGEHIVRETFYMAGALLESDDPEDHAEAMRAIRAVIGMQNTYEPSSSYGNWPRVVQRPGDFNAQNIGGFIGAEIIIILQRHADILPDDLQTALREALRRAAHRSRRYNPPATATNIITKAIAVALIADAMLDLPEVRAWAAQRLRELHAHTLAAGMPTEYNSPTYNRVTLEALTLLRTYFQDEELSPLIEDLHHISWSELALNYHPNMQLWVGNAARSYDGIMHPGDRLQEATDFHLFFGELSASRLPETLPEDLRVYFDPLTEAETRVIPVLEAQSEADVISQRSVVPLFSTVHLDPSYALASFNRGDCWNQRRALTLTWGRRDRAGHLYLGSPSGQNGLLAAQTAVAQDQNRLLMLVNFATDAGWGQHPWELFGLDREAPGRSVTDLRIRFHAIGADRLTFVLPDQMGEPILAEADGIRVAIRLVGALFGDQTPSWQVLEGNLDLVLNQRETQDLQALDAAVAAIALEVLEGDAEPDWIQRVTLDIAEDVVTLRAPDLHVTAGKRPAPYAQLQEALSF